MLAVLPNTESGIRITPPFVVFHKLLLLGVREIELREKHINFALEILDFQCIPHLAAFRDNVEIGSPDTKLFKSKDIRSKTETETVMGIETAWRRRRRRRKRKTEPFTCFLI